jgi:hypothetical protein
MVAGNIHWTRLVSARPTSATSRPTVVQHYHPQQLDQGTPLVVGTATDTTIHLLYAPVLRTPTAREPNKLRVGIP